MHKTFGAIKVQLTVDVPKGLRVIPVQTPHTGEYPRVTNIGGKSKAWIGITLEAGKAGDIVPVMPPYGGLVMVKVECDETPVRTGYWANTEANGYFSCHAGTGEIYTGLIVTPELDEAIAPGKVVEAMIFTGRFTYDGYFLP